MLLLIILTYRLIPTRIRRIWSGGCSTSHLALAELQSGRVAGLAAWLMVARMATPHFGETWKDVPHMGNRWDGMPANHKPAPPLQAWPSVGVQDVPTPTPWLTSRAALQYPPKPSLIWLPPSPGS